MKSRLFIITGLFLFGIGMAAGGVSAQTINDAQIAHIVVTANQVDIDAGQIADSRAIDS